MAVKYFADRTPGMAQNIAGFAGLGGIGPCWSFAPTGRYRILADGTELTAPMGRAPTVFSGTFTAPTQIAGVSGLTACVGLLVFDTAGGAPTTYSVVHFNGNFDQIGTYTTVLAHFGGGAAVPATVRAIIVFSGTASDYQRKSDSRAIRAFLANIGIPDAHVLVYWHRELSGIGFYLKGDGSMGSTAGRLPPPAGGSGCCVIL